MVMRFIIVRLKTLIMLLLNNISIRKAGVCMQVNLSSESISLLAEALECLEESYGRKDYSKLAKDKIMDIHYLQELLEESSTH